MRNGSTDIDSIDKILRPCLEVAPVGFLIADAKKHDHPIIYCNTSFTELTGYTMNEIIGSNCRFLQGPDTNSKTVLEIKNSLLRDGCFVGEILNYRKDGKPFWNFLRIAPFHLKDGELTHFISSVSHISKFEEALNERTDYEKIISSSHDFHAIIDSNYRYTVLNNMYMDYFGDVNVTRNGTNITSLYDTDTFEKKLKPQIDRCFKGEHVRFEVELYFPAKGKRYMEIQYKPLYDNNNNIEAILVNKRDITEQKKNENLLRRSRQGVRKLAEKLNLVREEERLAISRELHDELGQRLTAIKLDTHWVLKSLPGNWIKLPIRLKIIMDNIDSILLITQNIAQRLRPLILDDLGLEAAIETEITEFQNRTNCICYLDQDILPIDIEEEIKIAIIRILQEALTNIARHAKAKNVSVELKYIAHELIMKVIDDGVGIGKKSLTSSGSIGLIGMRERAGALGGRVNLEGSVEGTVLHLKIPLSGLSQ